MTAPVGPAAEPVAADWSFLADGGEMGERIRAFDWSATPLGEPAGWPHQARLR